MPHPWRYAPSKPLMGACLALICVLNIAGGLLIQRSLTRSPAQPNAAGLQNFDRCEDVSGPSERNLPFD